MPRKNVKKPKQEPFEMDIRLSFIPEAIGAERTSLVWKGIAMIIAGVAEEDEKDKLLQQMTDHKGGGFKWSSRKVKEANAK